MVVEMETRLATTTPVAIDIQCLRSSWFSYSGSANATVVGPSSQTSQWVWAMYCG
jgi:hypothetical protein